MSDIASLSSATAPTKVRRTLIAIVPAFRSSTKSWESLITKLVEEESLRSEDGEPPHVARLDHHTELITRGSLKRVCDRLRAQLDVQFHDEGPFDRVLLFGHSMGGLVVRAIFLDGLREKESWAMAVDRIVLLAGLSRGFVCGNRGRWAENGEVRKVQRLTNFGARYALPVLNLARVVGRPPLTVTDILAGSDFVTSLRLRWMRGMENLDKPPVVVQVLGTEDELVEPEDSLDTQQFKGSGIVRVPGANHSNIIQVGEDGGVRYRAIRRAVIDPPHVVDTPLDHSPKPVVFLLHGIHASRFGWVRKLRDHLNQTHPEFEVMDGSYGPFTFLDFIRRKRRHAYTQWFLDRYTLAMARNPKQPIHFVGHSFGTFVLADSLNRFNEIKFDRIVLAGSVLPCDYDWSERFLREQFRCLRSHMGTKDFPVGILSRGLSKLNGREIGSGGFNGFQAPAPGMQEYFRVGGHGCAVDDQGDYESITEFLVKGYESVSKNEADKTPELWKIASNFSELFVPVAVALLLLGGPICWILGWHAAAIVDMLLLGLLVLGALAFTR